MDLNVSLPSVEELFGSKDLSDMSSNTNFKFLIQTGYEHIQRTTTTADQNEQDDSMEM